MKMRYLGAEQYLQENIQALHIKFNQEELKYLDQLANKIQGEQYPDHLQYEV